MMLAITLAQYNRQYILLLPAVKNTMVDDGVFVRMMYSTDKVTFNGLFLYIRNESSKDVCAIEKDILQMYTTSKTPVYSVERQLLRTPRSVLKISGIWENETSYGLVYKCMD
jgi:hypothetical protein